MTRRDRYVVMVAALLASGKHGTNFIKDAGAEDTLFRAASWLRQAESYYKKYLRREETGL